MQRREESQVALASTSPKSRVIDRAFLESEDEVTMMSWIKLDNDASGVQEIMGQRNFRLFLNSSRKPRAFVKTNSPVLNTATTPANNLTALEPNLWYHLTAIYNANQRTLILYINILKVR